MGLRSLRKKVRRGCPPRVLSPPPHRTQSWRPCLPGQLWVLGWRSTDRPVPSPRGWMIGFSERGAAHNRVLLRCLFSQRCMRSWRSRGWPLSRPEAARLSPPSSLPSMAGLPGGTRAFPRWRERSQCTCARETQPLGGIVHVSRPKPVSWRLLLRPKLIVLRARQPLPCMPWLSCRYTKPRRTNKCTRVVPTQGWCRSCTRRLTSLYRRWKSRRGPSGRRCPPWWSKSAISGSTCQRWRTSTKHAFLMPLSPRLGCSATLSKALPSSSRQCRSRQRRSSTSCPGWMHHQPPLPPGPGLRLLVTVGALLHPPELLRPVLNRHLGRGVEPLAGVRRLPRPSRAPSRPGNRRSSPDAGYPEMLEFALSQETARTAPLLPLEEGRAENPLFHFVSAPPLERAISFSSGFSGPQVDSVRRLASWRTNLKASRAPWEWGLTPHGVLPPPMRWRTAPLWQTSVELWAGRHWTSSRDSTASALSQFLPVCWVTGNWQEELAGVTLAAPLPLTRGYERLFLLPVQFPGRWTLVEFLQHPRQSDWAEQSDARPSTGVSSPGSPVSPCTGLGVRMTWFPSGNPIRVFFHGKVSLTVNPCLPFDRALCQALLAALLPTPR